MMIVPFLISLVANLVIFIHVRSSSRRVHAEHSLAQHSTGNMLQTRSRVSRRDLHLLRHTIIMFCIFFVFWCPVYLLLGIDNNHIINPVIYAILAILAESCLLWIIISLFMYNKELRQYLKSKILPCL